MQTNDYILKTIEALSRLVAKIIGLKERGQFTEALKEVQLFKDSMLDSIKNDHRCIDMLGEFYEAEGDLHTLDNDGVLAQKSYSYALEQLQRANVQCQTYSFERELMISRIENKLIKED